MKRRLATLSAIIIVSIVPVLAAAQTPPAGSDGSSKIVSCNGSDCNLESFATLVQNLLNFGIFFASIIASILFAYAGWLYLSNAMTGPQSITQAKSIFKNVAVGYLLILGAWLIVDTLLGSLLGTDFGSWNVF